MKELERVEACVQEIKRRIQQTPKIAAVLGSGLGGLADRLENPQVLSYRSLPYLVPAGVEGHEGAFVFGQLDGIEVVVLKGRIHYYEGHTMEEVVRPIRVLAGLGVKKLLLTNAAGGICESFAPGDLMMISDHISSFVPSPLIGKNEEAFGVRFPDMSKVYCEEWQQVLQAAAKDEGISLQTGVYLQFSGPQYETPAEIKMARVLGADAVGMSTACEAIAANHAGLFVGGISLITNLASGMGTQPLSHEEVQETAAKAAKRLERLVVRAINLMNKEGEKG